MSRLVVLYGSQTGAAKSLAERVHEEAEARGMDAELHALNDFRSVGLKPEPKDGGATAAAMTRAPSFSTEADAAGSSDSRYVIITSTTGNGDPPDNAERFWRWVHRRSLPDRYYDGVRVAVLGLGDTNYDKFCHTAKRVREAMIRLGASEFTEAGFADEAMGLEATVDPWMERLWPAACRELGVEDAPPAKEGADAGAEEAKEAEPAPAPAPAAGGMGMLAQMRARQVRAPAPAPAPAPSPAAGGMGMLAQMRARQVRAPAPAPKAAASAPADEALASALPTLTAGVVHPRRSGTWPAAEPDADALLGGRRLVPRLPAATITLEDAPAATAADPKPGLSRPVRSDADEPEGYGPDAPVTATVRAARFLTAGGATSTRRVVHLELDVSGTAIADAWGPGDSVGVLCPNPLREAEGVCARLRLDPKRRVTLSASTGTLPHHLSRSGAAPTLREVFTWCVGLRGGYKKSFLRLLAEHCAPRSAFRQGRTSLPAVPASRAEADRRALLFLCARGDDSKRAWAAVVERQALTVLDLLSLFPSALPPAAAVLSVLPALAPRFYSIASTPLDAPSRVAIVFTIVTYRCGGEDGEDAPPARQASTATALGGSGPITRHGLATHFLELLASGLLRQSEAASKKGGSSSSSSSASSQGRARGPARLPTARLFLRRARDFRPPASLRWPLVLIGPGTGVAPFRGFLRHREARIRGAVRQRAAVCTGEWRGGFTVDFLEDDCAETAAATCGAGVPTLALTPATATAAAAGTPPGHGATPSSGSDGARARAAAAAALSPALGRPSGIRAAGTPAGRGDAASESLAGPLGPDSDGAQSPRSSLRSMAGETALFFGNRARDVDFLYSADWDHLRETGALSRLHTAFSREAGGGYVQDRLREPGTASGVAKSVLEDGAHVFVCGDGNAMAKDVHSALVDVLAEYDEAQVAEARRRSAWAGQDDGALRKLPAPGGREGAEALLRTLAARGRYVRDIWVG